MMHLTDQGIHCYMDAIELEELLKLMKAQKVKTVLELGTCNGGSAMQFVKIGCEVTSIDQTDQREPGAYGFKFMESKTEDAHVKLAGQEFDMIFIDADHSKAERDFGIYWHMAKKLIVFDDINYPPVKHDWENCSRYRYHLEIHSPEHHVDTGNPSTQWNGLGVIFVQPPKSD